MASSIELLRLWEVDFLEACGIWVVDVGCFGAGSCSLIAGGGEACVAQAQSCCVCVRCGFSGDLPGLGGGCGVFGREGAWMWRRGGVWCKECACNVFMVEKKLLFVLKASMKAALGYFHESKEFSKSLWCLLF
ncbi:hypothetical protein [Bartonella raoultii]|uniref:hypothetical protein n=1 Tax=Bartonella raoultii TaxID=1457020 RepID=UPI001ABAE3A8|nr:hypothetical protein [Bartonella raoultii]